MATLIAAADGNWTAATTWQVVDATSLLDSQAGNFALATSPSWSQGQAFTPGAITIDGIAVKVASRATTPSGTISVRLFNVTGSAAVAGTTVTINVSDLALNPVSPGGTVDTCPIGWVLFRFASPVTLAAATQYRVEAQTSAASQVNLFRDATANNMARMLRRTTTAAPAAGDSLFVLGEWTAAGTKTDRTVTMDSTAATDYGGGSTTLASLGIGSGGTLAYGTAAATNYVLRLSGVLQVWIGGTFRMGSPGTPIPRDSTAVLEFDCAATGDFGAVVWGTLSIQGQSPTAGKDRIYTRLTANAAAAATSLTVEHDTGWKAGQEIAIASTTRTPTEAETATLAADAGASTLSLTAGLASAHAGDTANDLQAEVILLSSHVQVRSTTSGAGTYLALRGSPTASLAWTLFRYVYGASSPKRGLDIGPSGGTVTVSAVVLRDCASRACVIAATGGTVSVSGLVGYTATALGTNVAIVTVDAANTVPVSLSDIVLMVDSSGSSDVLALQGAGALTLTRAWVSGGASSVLTISPSGTTWTSVALDTVYVHSQAGTSSMLSISARVLAREAWTRLHVYRGNNIGLTWTAGASGELTILASRFFGSVSNLNADADLSRVRFVGCTIAGDSSFASQRGFRLTNAVAHTEIRLEGCQVGVAGSFFASHTVADIDPTSGWGAFCAITLVNTTLGSATRWSTNLSDNAGGYSYVAEQRKGGSTGVHETTFFRAGKVSRETTVFRTAEPSEKLEPTGGTTGLRLRSATRRIAVNAGQVATVGVYVRKSAAYNGAQPRLILRANPAVGVTQDTVLDTMTSGPDSWEQLTGTSAPAATEAGVLEVYVDCDGSAGAVYVDDWTASVA
ncbi:MAG: hypothetical protein QN178_14065 [Armatimonadota bacterium]|nr:hypothetical protein [Armatimonadota bacterium]